MEEFKLPEKFDEYAQGRKSGFLKVKAAKEAGKKVAGYFCTFTPLEIMDAAGMISVSLCGMSEETIPDAEKILPKSTCPLIKSSYGFALTDKCPYTYWSDLIVGETTCDGKKKMFELLGEMKNTYILHLPQGVDEEYAKDMWVRELHRFIDYLSREFDVTITDKMIRNAAIKRNQLRHARTALMETLAEPVVRISGLSLYKFMDGLGFNMDLDQAISDTQELRENILSGNVDSHIKPNAKRILITGCPIGGVIDKVGNAVERNGGVIVCYENCAGIKATRCYVDTEKEDIVQALADAYLDIGCAVMTPNDKRIENLTSLIREFKVDGVIDISLQACTTYMIETRKVAGACRKLEIPYMDMQTDYSTTDTGQLETRIAAFIEMLE